MLALKGSKPGFLRTFFCKVIVDRIKRRQKILGYLKFYSPKASEELRISGWPLAFWALLYGNKRAILDLHGWGENFLDQFRLNDFKCSDGYDHFLRENTSVLEWAYYVKNFYKKSKTHQETAEAIIKLSCCMSGALPAVAKKGRKRRASISPPEKPPSKHLRTADSERLTISDETEDTRDQINDGNKIVGYFHRESNDGAQKVMNMLKECYPCGKLYRLVIDVSINRIVATVKGAEVLKRLLILEVMRNEDFQLNGAAPCLGRAIRYNNGTAFFYLASRGYDSIDTKVFDHEDLRYNNKAIQNLIGFIDKSSSGATKLPKSFIGTFIDAIKWVNENLPSGVEKLKVPMKSELETKQITFKLIKEQMSLID